MPWRIVAGARQDGARVTAPDETRSWQQGFILTQDWQDTAQGCRVVLCGRGVSGPFELQIPTRPVLFVPRDRLLPDEIRPVERRAVTLTTFSDRLVDALYFERHAEHQAARALLRENQVPHFEGDINPADRYLMERFIHGSCAFAGRSESVLGVEVWCDPHVRRADYLPELSWMSLDIETGSLGQLYSIAYVYVYGARRVERVHMVGSGSDALRPLPDGGEWLLCADEHALLKHFLADVASLDPDLLVGWNILGFDLPVLRDKCTEHGLALSLGRRRQTVRFSEANRRTRIHIHGRAIVDGIPALRGAFYRFDDFRLETVARELLGIGKSIAVEGVDKVAEIDRQFRDAQEELARYNLQDCRLVVRILERTGLIDLMVSRVCISGMLMDRLHRSVGAFDHFYLPRLHRKGRVAPDLADVHGGEHAAGGLVLPPQAGLFEHVVVLDFKSLYPSIIRTFKIDPFSRLRNSEHPIRTPMGTRFSSTEHILPAYIEHLMMMRSQAKSEGKGALSQAIKILMNSFYGVMGSPNCRFYDHQLPSSITGTGQWILRTTRDELQEQGYRVLYGDTDSVFVQLKEHDRAAPHRAAQALVERLNCAMTRLLHDEFAVESALELEFETYFRRFYLPSMRGHHGEGAAKRYAGLAVDEEGETSLQVTGLESVRSDWTPMARGFQRALLLRLFRDEEVEGWICEQVAALRSGQFDADLVYRKHIRKALDSYTRNVPPHVRAARLLPPAQQGRSNSIEYVMTHRGPVPVALPHDDLDYDHYLERQLAPLADDILSLRGTSLDAVIGGQQQLELF